MRVLAVHRYYYPDTSPYATLLQSIVNRWVRDGHEVDVLTSQPSYRSSRVGRKLPKLQFEQGVRVRRLRLPRETGRPLVRLTNAARLSASTFVRAASGRYDVVMVSTVPPVVLGAAASVGCLVGRTRLIYHCMDLHPEIGRISGEFASPTVFSTLRGLDSATMRKAQPVVVLSRDMQAQITSRPRCADATVVVRNNFSLPNTNEDSDGCEEIAESLWRSLRLPSNTFVLLFAGNIGRFQGIEEAVAALAILKRRGANKAVHLVLMGDGSARESLRLSGVRHKVADRLRFLDSQSVGVAKAVMRMADAGLVSLAPSVVQYAYPSKTATYLQQGCPLVVMVEQDSQLACQVEEHAFGVVASPPGRQALARVIAGMTEASADQLRQMSANARSFAGSEFDEVSALDWWSKLLAKETP